MASKWSNESQGSGGKSLEEKGSLNLLIFTVHKKDNFSLLRKAVYYLHGDSVSRALCFPEGH